MNSFSVTTRIAATLNLYLLVTAALFLHSSRTAAAGQACETVRLHVRLFHKESREKSVYTFAVIIQKQKKICSQSANSTKAAAT